MKRTRSIASAVFVAAAVLAPATADVTTDKLVPAVRGALTSYGVRCALDGDVAAVGDTVGHVVTFRRTSGVWSEGQTIGPGGGIAFAGPAVAVDGTTMAVCGTADGTDGPAGPAVHVFQDQGGAWVRQTSLRPSDPANVSMLTGPVAVGGDTIVAGDALGYGATTESGSVYVFARTGGTWSQQAKLVASDGKYLDRFGWSLALDGDTLLIGALGVDDAGNAAGAAYVFVRSGTTWTEQAKLLPNSAATYDQVGTEVALAGDRAFLGAQYDDDYGRTSGTVFCFMRSGTTWWQYDALAGPDPHTMVYFGSSLDAEGERLLVGALGYDTPGAYAGRAYLFTWDPLFGRWDLRETLVSPEAAEGDQFGSAASMSGSTLLVGAPSDKDLGDNTGSAWVFEVVQATDAAFVPTTVEVVLSDTKSADRAQRAPGLYAKGILDTGASEVDLTEGGAIVVGTRMYFVDGLTRSANGRTCSYEGDHVDYVVTTSASGGSRATFSLVVADDLRGSVNLDGSVRLGWSGRHFDAVADVPLSGGKFKLTSQPGTLDPDTMLCLAASGRCVGAAKDSFTASVRWGGASQTLSGAPDVTVAFGPVFEAKLDPAKFRLRKGVWTYSDPKARGIFSATFDPRLCKATFRARRCSVGEFAQGFVPLEIRLTANDMKRAVSVRVRMKGRTLKY